MGMDLLLFAQFHIFVFKNIYFAKNEKRGCSAIKRTNKDSNDGH